MTWFNFKKLTTSRTDLKIALISAVLIYIRYFYHMGFVERKPVTEAIKLFLYAPLTEHEIYAAHRCL